MSFERPSPHRFAAALAERLDHVVPSGLVVRAEGLSVDVYKGSDDRHPSTAADIIGDEDGRTLAERIDTAARAILSDTQDAVMELLTVQWPLGPNGRAADPDARVEGDWLLMWFGGERAPVVSLPPLRLADVVEGAA